MKIIAYTEFQEQSKYHQIKEIFLESSGKKFSSEEESHLFFTKWTSYYFREEQEFILLAVEKDRVLGYLMGSTNSDKVLSKEKHNLTGLENFQELFVEYPAHLHINFRSECRGRGLGSQLIEEFIKRLKDNNIQGVHIITSSISRNVGFYKKNGFSFMKEKPFHNATLLFMGRVI